MWALALAAFPDTATLARPIPATFDLRSTIARKTRAKPRRRKAATPPALLQHRLRSPYLLPTAELPAQETPDIQLRWKLRKVKLTMVLPSI